MASKADQDWRETVGGLAKTLAEIDRTTDDNGLRVACFALWSVLALAPSPIKDLYRRVSEAAILADTEAAAASLAQSDFGLSITAAENDVDVVRRIAVHLRAIETRFTQWDLGGRPSNPSDAWRIELDGESAFFVPMSRIAWREPRAPEKDIRPSDQRGLVRVRIIPAEVDGAEVLIVRPDRVRKVKCAPSFGAALFPNLMFELEVDKKDRSFLVKGVTAPGMDAHVEAACEQAHSAGCIATVFPELTIDNNSRQRIRDLLVTKPWNDRIEGGTHPTPAIVVAGSWHEPEAGEFVNVATVFDGDGEELLRHRKRYAYIDEDGCLERIQVGNKFVQVGNKFAILVLDLGLFAFGICLDFCHRGFVTPYGDLDVDFVLVPSCGNAKTMKGHVTTAEDLLIRRKTRSFVVQQAYPQIPQGPGYVLPPDGLTNGKTPDTLISAKPWSVFYL